MTDPFSIRGQVAVITGGSGVLGREMALALARAGAKVVVLSRGLASCERVVAAIQQEGGQAWAFACDVTVRADLERVQAEITRTLGPVSILVNAAGGNRAQATTSPELPFFALDEQAISETFQLNFTGTLLACQVFGQGMAEQGAGCIVNISSMASLRPLTRVVSYGAAKAAINNFTQWLAVYLAREYSPRIRVNALAPGFFLTEQNRFLMLDPQGGYTARGQAILDHTPAGRFGEPADLTGALLWLVSPAASFVTGIVVPIDGGFSAFSGV
ncbi:SDR family oxidoreductase [Thermosporothrix hazakensis]|jgi:NAD(P)-dependent dehydrogenase (short-subunit alcohol dehydrogenase family)|nr:SDR family oxidoreductase [Thermosporothrix hazakensis]GCE45748.1 dioxygenase [Thermosporothrix hazakensis]